MKKIGIVGSRTFSNLNLMRRLFAKIKDPENTIIVSGGAKGADAIAEELAKEFNIQCEIFLPDWDLYGKKAGFIRNVDIVKNSDIVFAFWDGKSKGTKSTINLCEKYKKKCVVINENSTY